MIHGDTPLTRLDKKVVGDLTKQNFYLVIYVKNKNKKLGGKFSLGQVFTNVGYIHKASEYSEWARSFGNWTFSVFKTSWFSIDLI